MFLLIRNIFLGQNLFQLKDMIKEILYFILLFQIIIVQPSNAQRKDKIAKRNIYSNSKALDANQIQMYFNNKGVLDDQNGFAACYWKQIPGHSIIVYNHGIWIVGKINDTLHLGISEWNSNYSPGPIINGQAAMNTNPADSLKYRVYKINKADDSSNRDYAEWPIQWGAPATSGGLPLVLGDQTLFSVYNSADTSQMRWWFSSTPFLPTDFEIQQTAFARNGNVKDNKDIFANTVFLEWTIINKGNKQIDSAYIGFWTDIDFFNAWDNPAEVDTALQLGYCWYYDSTYYDFRPYTPPAVGYVLLYGPKVYSPVNTAIFKGKQLANFTNLSMTSFHAIRDDAEQNSLQCNVISLDQVWNVARGFDYAGNIIIDSSTNKPTKFPFAGDPITNTGYVNNTNTGGGAGFVFFSGPFNFTPSDTQWIMAALIPAEGNNRFESIKLMREKAAILRSLPYDTLAFGKNPIALNYIDSTNINIDSSTIIPVSFNLAQNYPNPFNAGTIIKYDVIIKSYVSLIVYDILGRKISELVKEEKEPGKYSVSFVGENLSSGIYFYQLKAGNYNSTKKMILLK